MRLCAWLFLAALLCAAPAHAATFRWTWPAWSADSTGAPVVGFPAKWSRATIEFSLDGGPRRLLYDVTCSRPGMLDGKRGWPIAFPNGLYRDSVRVWIATADSAGNWSAWATAAKVVP